MKIPIALAVALLLDGCGGTVESDAPIPGSAGAAPVNVPALDAGAEAPDVGDAATSVDADCPVVARCNFVPGVPYSCFDLQNDPTHCGNCYSVCGADQYCAGGGCWPR